MIRFSSARTIHFFSDKCKYYQINFSYNYQHFCAYKKTLNYPNFLLITFLI